MQFCEINIYEVMIFRLYTAYNKTDKKNWQLNQRKIASIIASARIILLPIVYKAYSSTVEQIYGKNEFYKQLNDILLNMNGLFSEITKRKKYIQYSACNDNLFDKNNII